MSGFGHQAGLGTGSREARQCPAQHDAGGSCPLAELIILDAVSRLNAGTVMTGYPVDPRFLKLRPAQYSFRQRLRSSVRLVTEPGLIYELHDGVEAIGTLQVAKRCGFQRQGGVPARVVQTQRAD
jgi:hypothetical protein